MTGSVSGLSQAKDPRETRIRYEAITEERWPECQVSPGCRNASPDGPCCGQTFWREVSREAADA